MTRMLLRYSSTPHAGAVVHGDACGLGWESSGSSLDRSWRRLPSFSSMQAWWMRPRAAGTGSEPGCV